MSSTAWWAAIANRDRDATAIACLFPVARSVSDSEPTPAGMAIRVGQHPWSL